MVDAKIMNDTETAGLEIEGCRGIEPTENDGKGGDNIKTLGREGA